MKEIEREAAKLAAEKFDLIIVGGGVYGVMLALEASRRNLRSLSLEKGDFCGKTSHNHLRTVHGGIRYLQSLDLLRFKHSVGERKWFLTYFPDFTGIMPCLMPLYNKGIYRKSILRAALLMNDTLSLNRNSSVKKERRIPNGKILSKDETKEIFPMIETEGLKGGAVWYDACLTEFQRFYIELLKLSCAAGASALNYINVTGLLQQKGETAGVTAVDQVTGDTIELKAPVVINATGPWARETAEIFHRDYPGLFEKRLLLWNVLFDRKALSNHALALSVKKGGGFTYFFHPWKNRLLIGTPEILVEKSADETRVPPSALKNFINDINKIVPGLNVGEKDILRIYPGILPANQKGKLTERPVFIDHGKKGGAKGLYSISGVKFTTSRLVADKTLSTIFPGKKKTTYDKILAKNKTEFHQFDYQWQPEDEKDMQVLKDIVKKEAVVHLGDLVLRRTSLGDNPRRALDILPRIRKLFNWQDKKWQQEVDLLKQQLKEGFGYKSSKLIVDGHVHVYPGYDVDKFFDSALTNMKHFSTSLYPGEENVQKILLFTEGKDNDFFNQFKKGGISLKNTDFKFKETKEECSIILTKKGEALCYILRGRQIVTKENLEVLAIASGQQIPDGLPIRDVIKKITGQKEIAVLAWGVGKWFFKRGEIIKQVIEENKSPYLFVGDNSARPGFWPLPRLFKLAKKSNIYLINGSDPLPFKEEASKVGSYGFIIEGDFNPAEPAKSFRKAVQTNPQSIRFFGSRDTTFSFFKRQAKMFLKKHL